MDTVKFQGILLAGVTKERIIKPCKQDIFSHFSIGQIRQQQPKG